MSWKEWLEYDISRYRELALDGANGPLSDRVKNCDDQLGSGKR